MLLFLSPFTVFVFHHEEFYDKEHKVFHEGHKDRPSFVQHLVICGKKTVMREWLRFIFCHGLHGSGKNPYFIRVDPWLIKMDTGFLRGTIKFAT